MSGAFLEVRDLVKYFPVGRTRLFQAKPAVLKAVDGISFVLEQGHTLGLVGESGCGKSTTARLVLRLIEATRGEVRLEGVELLRCSPEDLQRMRREMQLVFQDPLSSLNPRMSVGVNIAEPLRFHGHGGRAERAEKARELLEVVGLKPRDYDRYPHEFSGGQCQRVAIARALILRPKLVVFDEPVSALDVSIQAQILNLLLRLQQDFALSYIFISHDLSVIKRVCDTTAVMYLGKIVELAPSETLYREPLHPYTQALMQAIPSPDPRAKRAQDLGGLEGDVPSPIAPPVGCRFHTRCPHRMPVCSEREPRLRQLASGHQVACFLHET
ncbi:MAG: ABC transporter ATP-binding protein [Kiloniellales bacterium]